jgi:hypothetical protein
MPRLLAVALCLSLAAATAPALAETPPPPSAPPAPPPPSADDGEGAPSTTEPGPRVERHVFEERLSPYGRWVVTPEYGRVWVPNGVAADWRPYSMGRWVLTDWGWTFVSDDPYGWAVYHYGRWNYGPAWGWYWVPGPRWAPAWVSWRYGGLYSAWAPLAPRGVAVWSVSSPYWVAVRTEHFTQPIRGVALAAGATAAAVAQTSPLAGPASRPMMGRYGPPVAGVAKATGQQLRPVSAPNVVPGAHAYAGPPRGVPGGSRIGKGPGATPPSGPPPGFRHGRGKRWR